ncbi:MAG: hypothetical protein SOZ62_00625 [Eubacteriales bacterium]|nr:hypothetical protein [Eubacteriales bacterium]
MVWGDILGLLLNGADKDCECRQENEKLKEENERLKNRIRELEKKESQNAMAEQILYNSSNIHRLMTRGSRFEYFKNRLFCSSLFERAESLLSHVKPLMWFTRAARILLYVMAYIQVSAVFLVVSVAFLLLTPIFLIVFLSNIIYGKISIKRREVTIARAARGKKAIVFFSELYSDNSFMIMQAREFSEMGFCVFLLADCNFCKKRKKKTRLHPTYGYREIHDGVTLFSGYCRKSLFRILERNTVRIICIY